ncbi:MAG: hypothetical protein JOY91_13080 [Sinobacteraceae bacterium]|nr:hypothetical protein [Nevskiaceae bacterium]
MAARRSTFSTMVALAALLLSSCGGSDYHFARPMVMFTAPMNASNINFGQGVQLAWTSTSANTCTAGSSSTIGGEFSGNQPVNGKATVAPTGTGTVTYTLTCTGYGGMATATTAAVTVNASILNSLAVSRIATIGSTVDPIEMGGNPYGLALAPVSAGLMSAGDLIVCNFNDGATNTQGLGTTIIGLHPTPGAKPYRIAQSAALKGCDALALLPDDAIAAASFSANDVPLVSSAGSISNSFGADAFAGPWGAAYAPGNGQNPPALYVSNVDGSIDRIVLAGDSQAGFTKIATGFCGSGQPGAIFAPAGLTYDAATDALYIVDTSSNSVVAFGNVSAIPASGIAVDGQCASVAAPPTPMPSFTGPSASAARVLAHGAPLIAPLSATLLQDGDLLVANADINLGSGEMPNLVSEVSPVLPGGFVGQAVQLDAGTPGALFGIVATQDAQGNQLVYFNDDNSNSVMVLTR